jgi:hypothetical protein
LGPPVRAVVPPVATWPTPGVARPLDGAVVAVTPEGAVVAGLVAGVVCDVVAGAAVVGVAVVGVWRAVVGVADVAGVEPPPIGGWVSGTVVGDVVAGVVVVLMRLGAVPAVVGGAAVVVLVVVSPLRTTNVATPAPRTPRISTISAMVRSRLRCSSGVRRGPASAPNDYAAWVTARRGPYDGRSSVRV